LLVHGLFKYKLIGKSLQTFLGKMNRVVASLIQPDNDLCRNTHVGQKPHENA
jgi:hypothetical protein